MSVPYSFADSRSGIPVWVHPSTRLLRLRECMAASHVESLLVTHLPDVHYLCGFTGSNAALAITPRKAALFTDGRYTTQAKAEARGVRVVIAKKSALQKALVFLGHVSGGKIYFDGENVSVSTLNSMRDSLPKDSRASLRPLKTPLVPALRIMKDADELARMQAAATLGDTLFESILPHIRPGIAEIEIAAELEYAARMAGAEGMSFSTIVASGERSALPHGNASTAKVPRQGFVTLDFGVIVSGYCSDMTRTVHVGKASSEERNAYAAVLEAQEQGVKAVAAGVTCERVDLACRSALKRHKLSKYFTHSTGHGVGLEIHEQPRIAKDQKSVLQAGMVITIEPGIYLPGKFGIRIEDMVAVGESASTVLTKATKAWIEV